MANLEDFSVQMEGNETYSATNKGRFLLWFASHAEVILQAMKIGDKEFFDAFDDGWMEIMNIFGLDEHGNNIELEFTRQFIIDNDMMWALGSAWGKHKRSLS